MKAVIISGVLPYPATSGGRIRTLNLTLRLARRHQITLLAVPNPDRAEGDEAVTYLRDHGIEAVEVGSAVAAKSGPAFYARLAANLASPLPYSVALFGKNALVAAITEIAKRGNVDLWQAEWTGAALPLRALRGGGGARTLVSAQNVETLIWERYAETEPNVVKREYVRAQARKFARFEWRVFAEAGRVVTVSEPDAALVVNRFGVSGDRVDVVDNGIDRAYFEVVSPDRDPREILFLGSLEWRPNLDALALFLDHIFPLVCAEEPSARLTVVGRNPPASLARRLAETEGASLHANVPDVRPFLARAGVLAVPLRVGGGSRLKILEALATGLPVVSTTVGAEGLDLINGQHLALADDPAPFAALLVATIRHPAPAQALAAAGRTRVLDRYDWDALADRLERSWERCVGTERAVSDATTMTYLRTAW